LYLDTIYTRGKRLHRKERVVAEHTSESQQRVEWLNVYRRSRRLESLLIEAKEVAEKDDQELAEMVDEALRRVTGNLDHAASEYLSRGGSERYL
jgi:hypothetical protein